MYEFINTGEKRYTEYLKCSNPTDSMQNQVSQKQNEDSDWSDDWDKSYVTDDIDNSPPTIEGSPCSYKNLELTQKERDLIDEFHKELKNISEENSKNTLYKSDGSVLKSNFERIDRLIDKYKTKGIGFNAPCDDYKNTVSNLIFEELANVVNRVTEITPTTRSRIDPATEEDALNELTDTDNFDFLVSIINKLLLTGANILYSDRRIDKVMWGSDESVLAKLEEIKNMLKSEVYESMVNSDKQLEDLKVEIDNVYLFIECSKNSSIEVAKITNSKISRDLNVKESILKIGDDIVKVEKVGKKRNYMDVVGNGIIISFPTKMGDIKIHLYPDTTDNNKIKVKLNEESQAKIDKLQDKSIMDKSFFLGGKKVLEAIKDENFERNGSVPTKLSETIEQSNNAKNKRKIPSSFMEKVCNVKKLFCGSSVDKT
ncbi:hypothetical protein [Candidatus Mesenet endosymbiont of Agriotes lineatus]|uniref:hypothetical protein n=1 Tax=Candidatus Mesenet endosymbiont of Agriotes lineatus TaxID=3077948 RepID=UPI0030D59B61